VLDELAQSLSVPCLAGVRIGHGDENYAVPLGARVRLDADEGRLTFLEGLAQP
jgi:muramoyltetrapeptide carboxypeptidase LdcA involved in peptidoglycan recycling